MNRHGMKNVIKALRGFINKVRWFFNYTSWLLKYVKRNLGFNTLRDIKILSIEFSSICNLRCKYCFIEKLERPKFLDIKIYEKLIKEVAENSRYKIRTIEWPVSGEFFVYPEYKQAIEITKKYMRANPHFRPHIILNENFMLFDEEKIEFILQSGIVKQIICSIDGHDAKSFEEMRPPAKFDVVLRNFRTLVRRNREFGHPIFIQINNGRDENSPGREFSEEMKEIFRESNDLTFWRPKFWNESFNKKEKHFYPANGFCTFVFNSVTLSASGFISKCCMDLKGTTAYADLRQNTLEEIWRSTIRKQFLTLMFKNQRKAIDGCKTCSITNTNNDNRYNNFYRIVKRKLFLPMMRFN